MKAVMNGHGHAKADHRSLALHRAALAKLKRHPELLARVLILLDEWLIDEAHAASRKHLREWREMLTEWPFQQMSDRVLDPEDGQVLRQCSPLGPVLKPEERWATFVEADRQVRAMEQEFQS